MSRTACFFDESFATNLNGSGKDHQYEIVKGFWPNVVVEYESFDPTSYGSFFQYLAKEIGHLRHHQRHFAVQSLDDTFAVVRALRENPSKSQTELIRTLSAGYLNVGPAVIQRSLELTVRLWLTLNVNSSSVAVGPIFPDETPLDWEHDVSLDALVKGQFAELGSGRGKATSSKIDPALTAAYLASTCGLRLRWTDSLSEHLRFNPRRQTLAVYRHKICLINHIESSDGCPIPEAVLYEILDTLNLLFPFGDAATKQLLIKERQQPLYQLGSCGRARKLDLANYEYFREELEYLIDSFNQPPKTWRQLATDTRNKMEWAVFWVTIMVAFLTLVSIPCNIIQATYSVKAYRATLQQLKEL
ncbi:hypothetical protein K458DRAFT_388045 [Lentithecium fluviatile CBS 122367]|uniref:Uncharacterized protein n=1 Tax=Lentithecium fluviatile CBS 122367 TaxID=1168545 RepID=A0A6G1J3P9_9PLEO|nr:hypothetical protein K458DRAFT_388045 [Lentithecium fluviatile CBS 122367]